MSGTKRQGPDPGTTDRAFLFLDQIGSFPYNIHEMLFNILIATILGSILSLIGGAVLLWKEALAKKFSLSLVSFAVGGLLGAAFLELLPEAFHELPYTAVAPFVIFGIFFLFLFEKIFHRYHAHDERADGSPVFVQSILIADSLHNFIDGITIALSFSVSTGLGIATTIAVFFHEIPQEIGDFGVMIHAGYPKAKVFLYNFLSGAIAILGALIGYFFLPILLPYLGYFLAFIVGTFLYIAISDLLPELKHEHEGSELLHLLGIALGVFAIWGISSIFPG